MPSQSEMDTLLTEESHIVPLKHNKDGYKLSDFLPGMLLMGLTYVAATLPTSYLPTQLKAVGINETGASLIISSYTYSYVAGVLLAPKLYRSYNPKPLLILFLSVFILMSVMFSFILTLSSNAIVPVATLIRVLQGGAGALYEGIYITVILRKYNAYMGFVSGIVQGFIAGGILVGPITGGLIYDQLGFQHTQLIVCAPLVLLFLLFLIFTDIVRKSVDLDVNSSDVGDYKKSGYWNVLRCWDIDVIYTLPFLLTLVESVPLAFLASYINEQYGLGSTPTGVILFCSGVCYVASSTVFGFLSDKFNPLIPFGLAPVIMSVSLFLIGPSRFVPWSQSYYQLVVMFGCTGLVSGIGCAPVIKIISKVWETKKDNFRDHTEYLYSILVVAFNAGQAIGTTMGGLMYSKLAFENLYTTLGAALAVYSTIIVAIIICRLRF